MEELLSKKKRILKGTVSMRNFISGMCANIRFDIMAAKFYRSTDLGRWFWWTWHLFKMKRNLKRANVQLMELTLIRLQLKSALFRAQYLERDLKAALRKEDYETAAEVRDKINLEKVWKILDEKKIST